MTKIDEIITCFTVIWKEISSSLSKFIDCFIDFLRINIKYDKNVIDIFNKIFQNRIFIDIKIKFLQLLYIILFL